MQNIKKAFISRVAILKLHYDEIVDVTMQGIFRTFTQDIEMMKGDGKEITVTRLFDPSLTQCAIKAQSV